MTNNNNNDGNDGDDDDDDNDNNWYTYVKNTNCKFKSLVVNFTGYNYSNTEFQEKREYFSVKGNKILAAYLVN